MIESVKQRLHSKSFWFKAALYATSATGATCAAYGLLRGRKVGSIEFWPESLSLKQALTICALFPTAVRVSGLLFPERWDRLKGLGVHILRFVIWKTVGNVSWKSAVCIETVSLIFHLVIHVTGDRVLFSPLTGGVEVTFPKLEEIEGLDLEIFKKYCYLWVVVDASMSLQQKNSGDSFQEEYARKFGKKFEDSCQEMIQLVVDGFKGTESQETLANKLFFLFFPFTETFYGKVGDEDASRLQVMVVMSYVSGVCQKLGVENAHKKTLEENLKAARKIYLSATKIGHADKTSNKSCSTPDAYQKQFYWDMIKQMYDKDLHDQGLYLKAVYVFLDLFNPSGCLSN